MSLRKFGQGTCRPASAEALNPKLSQGTEKHQIQRQMPRGPRRSTHCVGDVVDNDGGLGTSVVHGGQAVIPLLPRRVPYLKLDRCVIQTDRLR